MTRLPTIFVQIPAYRDAELPATLQQMLVRAAHPQRVTAGVCWQYKPGAEAASPELPAAYAGQIRVTAHPIEESKGVCWARHQAQAAYNGEDYTLITDSHMRFVQGWDDLLIAEWKRAGDPQAVLTQHPPPYAPPETLPESATPNVLRAHPSTLGGDIRFRGEPLVHLPPNPLRGAFASPAMLFAPGAVVTEVPHDPYMYFEQEELCLSARLFTHGWNVYHPTRIFCYHLYDDTPAPFPRYKHWDDRLAWATLNTLARERRDHLLGRKVATSGSALKELDAYGNGTARTLKEYAEFCGIDLETMQPSKRALTCGFIPDAAEYISDRTDVLEAAPVAVPESNRMPVLYSPFAGVPVSAFRPASPDALARPLFEPALPEQYWDIPRTQAPAVITRDIPPGLLIIENYASPRLCRFLMDYVDKSLGYKLQVVDSQASTTDKVISVDSSGRITEAVSINGVVFEVLSLFMDIYLFRLAPFYGVTFEWFEHPQILRYRPGGKYDPHADSEELESSTQRWRRVLDRDYSVLLYLNEGYEGGSLNFDKLGFTMQPKAGMLAAFPSDHRYQHAALPTTKGTRYVIVSWSAIVGAPRVKSAPPFASHSLNLPHF